MLDIDFFDQSGKWNPKVVLFSAATAPQRAQSGLTKLFGGLMKFQARRWAENYFHDALRKAAPEQSPQQPAIKEFLKNIKRSGEVDGKEFYRLATVDLLQKTCRAQGTSAATERSHRAPNKPGPTFLNSREVIVNTLIEMLETGTKTGKFPAIFGSLSKKTISAWVNSNASDDTKINLLSLLERSFSTEAANAHRVIANLWEELSAIQGGEYASSLIRDAAESGFLDYCEYQRLPAREADRERLKEFLATAKNDWEKYRNLLSEGQYQNFTRHRDHALKKLEETQERSARTENPQKAGLKYTLQIQEKLPTEKNAIPAHEAIFEKWNESADPRVEHSEFFAVLSTAINSGFIQYCRFGIVKPIDTDPDSLEEFCNISDKQRECYKNILTAEQFVEFEKKHAEFSEYIKQQSYDLTHKPQSETTAQEATSNDQSKIYDTGSNYSHEDFGILFSTKEKLSLKDLWSIEWKSPSLYSTMFPEDLNKIQDYFTFATTSHENKKLARKIISHIRNAGHIIGTPPHDEDKNQYQKFSVVSKTISKAAEDFLIRHEVRTKKRPQKTLSKRYLI